jgi:hypothetical protein
MLGRAYDAERDIYLSAGDLMIPRYYEQWVDGLNSRFPGANYVATYSTVGFWKLLAYAAVSPIKPGKRK